MVYNFKISETWKYTFKYDDVFIKWMNKRIKTKEACVQEEKDEMTKSFNRTIENFKLMVSGIEDEVKTEVDTIIKCLTKSFEKNLKDSIKEVEDSYSIKEQLSDLSFFEFDEKDKTVTYFLDMGIYGRYNYADELPYFRTPIYSDDKWHIKNPEKYKRELYSDLGNASKKFTLLKIEEVVG